MYATRDGLLGVFGHPALCHVIEDNSDKYNEPYEEWDPDPEDGGNDVEEDYFFTQGSRPVLP